VPSQEPSQTGSKDYHGSQADEGLHRPTKSTDSPQFSQQLAFAELPESDVLLCRRLDALSEFPKFPELVKSAPLQPFVLASAGPETMVTMVMMVDMVTVMMVHVAMRSPLVASPLRQSVQYERSMRESVPRHGGDRDEERKGDGPDDHCTETWLENRRRWRGHVEVQP
jgi:hypothetical protein